MTLFDRYVLRMFVKIILVCFTSLAGLYLIIDVFNNLDEFLALGKLQGSLPRTLFWYYSPRLVGLFCEVSGLLYLLAAICTLTRLYSTRELAAVQAAGISIRRVARPLILLTTVLCVTSLACRELILPRFRDTLTANAQELLRSEPKPVISQIDYANLVMIRGQSIDPQAGQIHQADFLLPPTWSLGNLGESNQILARNAVWLPADSRHPAGYLLDQLQLPNTAAPGEQNRETLPDPGVGAGQNPSGSPAPLPATPAPATPAPTAPAPVALTSYESQFFAADQHDWLGPEQCFIASGIPVQQLSQGVDWFRGASLAELMEINRTGSVRLPSVHRVEMHWRLIRPVLDFSVLLIGLPLVLRREGQKLVVAAAYCLMLMLGVQLLVMACHFLGAQQILKPAALAAWLPVLIVFPIAIFMYQRFDH